MISNTLILGTKIWHKSVTSDSDHCPLTLDSVIWSNLNAEKLTSVCQMCPLSEYIDSFIRDKKISLASKLYLKIMAQKVMLKNRHVCQIGQFLVLRSANTSSYTGSLFKKVYSLITKTKTKVGLKRRVILIKWYMHLVYRHLSQATIWKWNLSVSPINTCDLNALLPTKVMIRKNLRKCRIFQW